MAKTQQKSSRKHPCSFFSETFIVAAKQGQMTIYRGGFVLLFNLMACLVVAAQRRDNGFVLPLLSDQPQQHQSEKSAVAPAPPKTDSPSPYRIEWLIDINDAIDLRQIWQMLNLQPPDSGSYKCSGTCEAETFELATTDAYQQKTVALRISYETRHFYQYLIFKQTGSESFNPGQWKLLGKIDCFDQQNAPPGHRLERGDQRCWLVIKAGSTHGREADAYSEVWYEIQASGLRRVLTYPVEGHFRLCQEQVGRSYKSFMLRHDMENGVYTIPIQLMIAYDINGCNRPDEALSLFARGQKIYYVWSAKKEQFVLDEARSETTQKQIDQIYDAQPLSDDAFVEANFQELAGIARSSDARRKAWLKNFVTRLQNITRQAELQRLLQQ